jgi:hypothetical protein
MHPRRKDTTNRACTSKTRFSPPFWQTIARSHKRRWPVEAGKAINATIGKAKSIGAVKARIKIADVDQTKPVGQDAVDVKFRVKLKAGSTRLETWFIDDKDESRGAYYCYIKRL